jgi:hypothetical protein
MGRKPRVETNESATVKTERIKISGFLAEGEIRLFFCFKMNNGTVKTLTVLCDIHLM